MKSVPDEMPAGQPEGVQQARLFTAPPRTFSSTGAEAIELAELSGLKLDPWQKTVLDHSLGEREDRKWAAFQVGVVVPRQNGKGVLLEARELAGLFLTDEKFIIHSAHLYDTSQEHFNRLLTRIENSSDFTRRVRKVSRSHNEEGITLTDGKRLRFRARTKAGGRGFTADLLILDEAMILPESFLASLLPTLSAVPNPQIWCTGSAVDQQVHEDGVVLARLRERAIKQDSASLVYFEWSLPTDHPEKVGDELAGDPESWAQVNPALGIRISADYIKKERETLGAREFAVERLGVGDWPRTDGLQGVVISPETWAKHTDPQSKIQGPVCFALDVTPDRSHAAICVAGLRSDGLSHVEVVEHKRGTGWLVERAAELVDAHDSIGVVLDAAGPVGSLLPELLAARIEITPVNAREHAQACGSFYDLVEGGTLRHLGQRGLAEAVRGAVERPLGDAWAWSRKNSGVDISPLVAATLALWGAHTLDRHGQPQVWDLRQFGEA
jgi:hypothetical protein